MELWREIYRIQDDKTRDDKCLRRNDKNGTVKMYSFGAKGTKRLFSNVSNILHINQA